MKNLNRFYTYAYLREDRTPYYVGKGKGNRLHQRHQKGISVPKDKTKIIFLKQNLTEEEAFRHEIYMIGVFGRKDLGTGILRNKTNGGEGGNGAVRSKETRRKQSEANKGNRHSKETRRKQSEVSKGKKWWNNGCGNCIRSVECPGENWILGRSDEYKIKHGELKKGAKWWNDGAGNNKLTKECPGEGWVLGLKEETLKRKGKATEGKKWWNDGCGNCIRSVECPGERYVPGRGKLKKTLSKPAQGLPKVPENAL